MPLDLAACKSMPRPPLQVQRYKKYLKQESFSLIFINLMCGEMLLFYKDFVTLHPINVCYRKEHHYGNSYQSHSNALR